MGNPTQVKRKLPLEKGSVTLAAGRLTRASSHTCLQYVYHAWVRLLSLESILHS